MRKFQYKNKKARKQLTRTAGARCVTLFESVATSIDMLRKLQANATVGVDVDGVIDNMIGEYAYNVEYMGQRAFQNLKREVVAEAYETARAVNNTDAADYFKGLQ